ncbi:MAG: VOC family protein, partial [Bacteroidetes bacterium]|nr:VOC family protein [Bacteroidota bacterium]
MARINPYITFNGNCEEAFLFYKSVFGGEFVFMGRFSEMPGEYSVPEQDKNLVMHVSLPIGN